MLLTLQSSEFIDMKVIFPPKEGLGKQYISCWDIITSSVWPLKNHGIVTSESHVGREAASLIRNYSDNAICKNSVARDKEGHKYF